MPEAKETAETAPRKRWTGGLVAPIDALTVRARMLEDMLPDLGVAAVSPLALPVPVPDSDADRGSVMPLCRQLIEIECVRLHVDAISSIFSHETFMLVTSSVAACDVSRVSHGRSSCSTKCI